MWFARTKPNFGRVFVNTATSITTWIGSANWGKDLSGALVDSQAAFNTAVAALRSPNGRDPGYAWANPTKWARFETDLAGSSAITGNYNETIAALNAMGVQPLMVIAVTCSDLTFKTYDPTNSSFYWTDRWEEYRCVAGWGWGGGEGSGLWD